VARLSATDAARSFSELLNRVLDGEEIEITRAGAPVAVIGPPRARFLAADRFRDLIASAPRIDDDFARDLAEIRRGVEAPEDVWPS
jgi:prevent-host-death family protein